MVLRKAEEEEYDDLVPAAVTDAGRRVGVATDFSAGSRAALQWAAENAVRDGDCLILIIVQKKARYETGEMQLWEANGTPFIPLSELSEVNFLNKYGVKNLDTQTLDILNNILAKEKKVEIMFRVYWGNAGYKICEAINKIPLSYLIMGSRGLGATSGVLMGSVSNYVLNNARGCPMTVVKKDDYQVICSISF